MFPGIDGFHWTVGHVVFLSLFFAVALTILATVGSAAWRTARDFRDRKATDLCWREDFTELPEIGLDALADHMIGTPDSIHLPMVGEEIDLNQIAWRIKKNGREILVRAPLEGTVTGVGDHSILRLRPRLDVQNPINLRHLLRGPEVHGWISRELERLQLQLRPAGAQPSLADGGVLVHGLMDALPQSDWNTVLADTFLEA